MKPVNKILLTFLFLFFFLAFLFLHSRKIETYQMNLFYFDTYIEVRFQTNKSKNEVEDVKQEITMLYEAYHNLANRYEEHGKNVYYLIHNHSDEPWIEVDPLLFELLEYGQTWISKSNGKLNINMGCVIDIWKSYQKEAKGIPTNEELKQCEGHSVLELKEPNQVRNNHADIDLGAIAKGYATEQVGRYLKTQGVTEFLINAGGNVLTGIQKSKGYYQVGIQSPDENGVFQVLKVENKAVVTSGGYERFYEYEGKRYHHILDPTTNYPGEYVKSVTVIAEDSALADALSTTLFLMSVEDGKVYLQSFSGVDAIWYQNDGTIVQTEGIQNYESK